MAPSELLYRRMATTAHRTNASIVSGECGVLPPYSLLPGLQGKALS